MRTKTHATTYNGHPISSSDKNSEGSYVEILHAADSLLTDMTQRHGRVFFTMFVVKYPANQAFLYPSDNSLLSRFIEALMLHCKRRNYAPKYLWVRECTENSQAHYHIMILLNSDYTQEAHSLLRKATELWGGCLNIEDARGLVHLCVADDNDRYGGVKIKRNAPEFPQVYGRCFERASYMAKCYSKGGSPSYVNAFGHSRLP